jgi:hypothetical protein
MLLAEYGKKWYTAQRFAETPAEPIWNFDNYVEKPI